MRNLLKWITRRIHKKDPGKPASVPHPLDGCDSAECYQIMMTERTELIKARRETEDNLIKTIIQLSSALIVLMSGFIVQSKINLSQRTLLEFSLVILFMMLSIIFGLTEQFSSSRAYLAQQILVEQYYTKKISVFREPSVNTVVRCAQAAAFFFFVLALIILGVFAVTQAGAKTDVEQQTTTISPTSTSFASFASR